MEENVAQIFIIVKVSNVKNVKPQTNLVLRGSASVLAQKLSLGKRQTVDLGIAIHVAAIDQVRMTETEKPLDGEA